MGSEMCIRDRYSGIKVNFLAISPDRSLLATAGVDHLVRIWNTRTSKLVVSLKGHKRSVDALAFSPDSNRLAASSRDGTTRFWDVSDLGSETGAAKLATSIPTTRVYKTQNGATVTVEFDKAVENSEIRKALLEVQTEFK